MNYDPEPTTWAIVPHVALGDIVPVVICDVHYDLVVVGIDENDVVLARTDYGHVVPITGVTYRPPTIKRDAYGKPVAR